MVESDVKHHNPLLSWVNSAYLKPVSRGCSRRQPPPPLKLEKIWFGGVKSWFFTRNTPKFFAPPSARRNFVKCAPLTLNPRSAPGVHDRECLSVLLLLVVKCTWYQRLVYTCSSSAGQLHSPDKRSLIEIYLFWYPYYMLYLLSFGTKQYFNKHFI